MASSSTSRWTPRASSSVVSQTGQKAARNLGDLGALERRERDDLVDAVVELGRKRRARCSDQRFFDLLRSRSAGLCRSRCRACSSALTSAAPRLDVRMMTVLVKSTVRPRPSVSRPSSNTPRNASRTSRCAFSISSSSTDLVRPAAHRFGELPTGVVTDVAGRSTDESRHRVRLGVLRHVETRHRVSE